MKFVHNQSTNKLYIKKKKERMKRFSWRLLTTTRESLTKLYGRDGNLLKDIDKINMNSSQLSI